MDNNILKLLINENIITKDEISFYHDLVRTFVKIDSYGYYENKDILDKMSERLRKIEEGLGRKILDINENMS